jgi:hypothetical protein
MAEVPQPGPGTALRLMRDRNFGPYFLGNASSASGTWFQNLAASLLVYRLTHSAFLLGVLNFCNFVPVLLLAPWAGSAADRMDRKRLLLVTQLGSAVALNSMTYNLARATGPALAAISVRTLGIPASFAINAGSYLLLVLALLVVYPAPRRLARRGEARLRESLRLVRDQSRTRSSRGSRSGTSSSVLPASAISPRTPPPRPGSSLTSRITSGGGSWRSGASRFSASGRSRVCWTGRLPARSGFAPPVSCSPFRCLQLPA